MLLMYLQSTLIEKTLKSDREFVGIDYVIQAICDILWKPFKFIDCYRYKKGKSSSIFIIAKKWEKEY